MISVPSSGDNSFVQAPPDIMREKFESISPNATCGSWQHPQTGDCSLVAMRKSVAGETWTHSLFFFSGVKTGSGQSQEHLNTNVF
eukprot:COSAG06_NODE_3880_length_4809_cov_2.363482_4_plen_85_part_00